MGSDHATECPTPPAEPGFGTGWRERLDRLYTRAGAGKWMLPPEAFDRALFESAAHRFALPLPEAPAIEEYFALLHLDDLALAAACMLGSQPAWEHLVETSRPSIRRAARRLIGEDGADAADSLYAELYCLDYRARVRPSLLRHYHGRSSLLTWLRAVMVRRHIDVRRVLARSRAHEMAAAAGCSMSTELPDPEPRRAHYHALARGAVRDTLMALPVLDRRRFAYYYRDRLSLSAVARHLDEHASTVSRQLARTRIHLRRGVEDVLRRRHGLDGSAVTLCFEWLHEHTAYDAIMATLASVDQTTSLTTRDGAVTWKGSARGESV